MSFPVTWADRTFSDGPSLLGAVLADAEAGGGQVVAGQAPSRWLAAMVEGGALDPELAVGLCAAMLQNRARPGAITEAARLAANLARRELAELLLVSLDAFDTGLLLTADPLDPGAGSVEDALLRAAWATADLDDPAIRERLVPRLRNAGLVALECITLVRHGAADEILEGLPAILIEGVPDSAAESLIDALSAREDVREALIASFVEARPDARAALLEAITKSDRKQALRAVIARLVPTTAAEA